MPDEIRTRVDGLVASATSRRPGDAQAAWATLEDAHVLSQPWARFHVRVHWAMLTLAWRTTDRRELAGQLSRLLLAAPGSWTGRYPIGNTGRARVSAFEPMPIRADLTDVLAVGPPADQKGSNAAGVLDSDGVRRLYDRIASRYDLTAAPFQLIRARRLAKQAIDELHLRAGDTVVDLGTGTGWNLTRLADRVGPTGSVIGVDISRRMLDQARRNVGDRANIELVEADIASYQPPSDTDAVISTFAIEMRPDYETIIERLAAEIRPGGRIAITGLRHADHWPRWLSDAGARAMRLFGVNDSYRTHRPWEAIQRHTTNATYADSHAGAIYLAAGTTPPPPTKAPTPTPQTER